MGNGENYIAMNFVICSIFALMCSSHDSMREMYGETRSTYIIFGLNISGEETIAKISEDNIKIYFFRYGLGCEEMNWIDFRNIGSGVEEL